MKRPLLFAGLILFVAVATIAATYAAIAYGRAKSDTSLLTRQPCAAPCWYGITPGVTTEADARALLSSVRFYTAADEVIDNRQSAVPWVSWYYSDLRLVNRITFGGGGVRVIHVEPGMPFTLRDVLSVYGEPVGTEIKVVAGSETLRSTVSVSLYYPVNGLLVKFLVYDGPLRSSFDLIPNAEGIDFELYPRADSLAALVAHIQSSDLNHAAAYVMQYLRSWPGFGSVIIPPHERTQPPLVMPSAPE